MVHHVPPLSAAHAAKPFLKRRGPPAFFDMKVPIHKIKGTPSIFYNGRRFILPDTDAQYLDDAENLVRQNDAVNRRAASQAASRMVVHHNLLSEPVTNKLAVRLQWLLPPPRKASVILSAYCILAIFIGTLSVESINTVSNFSIGNGLLALLLSLMLLFLHELGHAAAATRCGLRSDGIGLGIYFLFPAMFTRISTLSLASSDEKIYFFSAGVYFQCIAQIVLLLLFHLTSMPWLMHLAAINLTLIITNAIPALQFDGHVIAVLLVERITNEKLRLLAERSLNISSKIFIFLILLYIAFNLISHIQFSIENQDIKTYGFSIFLNMLILGLSVRSAVRKS